MKPKKNMIDIIETYQNYKWSCTHCGKENITTDLFEAIGFFNTILYCQSCGWAHIRKGENFD